MCVCLRRSNGHQKLVFCENSFPGVFGSVEPVYERESDAELTKGVHVRHSHFQRGENSENWFVRKRFLHREDQIGRIIVIIYFRVPLVLLSTAKGMALANDYRIFSEWLNNSWLPIQSIGKTWWMGKKHTATGALDSTNDCLSVRMNAVMSGVILTNLNGRETGEIFSSLARVSIRACHENHRMGEQIISPKLRG